MGAFRRELRSAVSPRRRRTLLADGVSRHALDGKGWRKSSHGLYVPASVTPSPAQRILEAAAVLPQGAVLGDWAAAYALGVDRLDGLDDRTMRPLRVTVVLPPSAHRRSTPTLRYVREDVAEPDQMLVGGIPLTSGVRTSLDLARWAADLTEAIVALDAMLTEGAVTMTRLRRGLSDLADRRGAPLARAAVELSRFGSRSTWESRLRMLLVLQAGWPMPSVNPPVFDLAGHFLGAPDLLDVEAGLAIEFDGRQHRDRHQHRADNVREELFERAGLIVARTDSLDMKRHRPQLLSRLAAARVDGLARDRRRDAWTLDLPDHWPGMPS